MDSAIQPNRDWDKDQVPQIGVCTWCFNPYEALSKIYVQIPERVIRASGMDQTAFVTIYLRFISSPGKGADWIHQGVYKSLTRNLREYLSRTSYIPIDDQKRLEQL